MQAVGAKSAIGEHAHWQSGECSEQHRNCNEKRRLCCGKVKSLTEDRSECANQPPSGKANGERDRSEEQVPLL
jgi:hypothetical protein